MRYYLLAAAIVTMLALPQAIAAWVLLVGTAGIIAGITPN